ncbi:MAG: hypothetical protein ACRC6M_17305, partial [Microcystaceae cyanobacterium]
GSEARTIRNNTKGFRWLELGPWCIDGKLDPNFRDWLADNWLKQYGGDIHTQRANVLSHFKKDPDNLPIRWEQYQGEYRDRITNTQILLNNGVEIPEEYQDRLINNQRALTQSLPTELNPIATVEPLQITRGLVETAETAETAETVETAKPLQITRGLVETVEPITAIAPQPITAPVDFVKNEDGHILKVWKAPKPVEEPITPEQWAEAKEKIAAFTGGKFGFGKSSPRNETPSKKGVTEDTNTAIALEIKAKKQAYFDQLNEWINDPILRNEAVKRAKASDCYKCLLDEEGIPYQVIWCEDF